jgi:hypothetical protein
MLLTKRDNQILGKLVIFEKLPTFWKLMEWIEKILRAKAASKWLSFCPKHLVKFYQVLGHFLRFRPQLPHFKSVLGL